MGVVMKAVLSVRGSCRTVGTALLVVVASLTLHVLPAHAQSETPQVPTGVPEEDLLLLPTEVAGPGAVSGVSGAALTAPLTFVGIAPCRIIDTRATSGFSGQFGPPSLGANTNRTFQITGTTAGTLTQCGIPDTAAAISVNFTVTAFAGPGDIRVFPAGGTLPLASVLNYRLENIANATTVPLGPSGSGHNGIAVRADSAATDFIADVNGYYLPSGVLASGQTATGGWAGSTIASAAGQYFLVSVSFPQRLASPLPANYQAVAAAPTAYCPGTSANPQAAAGEVCVYATGCDALLASCLSGPGTSSCGADVYGVLIPLATTGSGASLCYGTWAVTAP
jgi:hypothetical protein